MAWFSSFLPTPAGANGEVSRGGVFSEAARRLAGDVAISTGAAMLGPVGIAANAARTFAPAPAPAAIAHRSRGVAPPVESMLHPERYQPTLALAPGFVSPAPAPSVYTFTGRPVGPVPVVMMSDDVPGGTAAARANGLILLAAAVALYFYTR